MRPLVCSLPLPGEFQGRILGRQREGREWGEEPRDTLSYVGARRLSHLGLIPGCGRRGLGCPGHLPPHYPPSPGLDPCTGHSLLPVFAHATLFRVLSTSCTLGLLRSLGKGHRLWQILYRRVAVSDVHLEQSESIWQLPWTEVAWAGSYYRHPGKNDEGLSTVRTEDKLQQVDG